MTLEPECKSIIAWEKVKMNENSKYLKWWNVPIYPVDHIMKQ